MDNNNFTQNNNQNTAGWQNIGQQGVYQQGMYPQNMVQQNVYQQTMNGQGMIYPGTGQPGMAQQNMYVQGNQPRLTRKDFINLPQMGNVKKNINVCAGLLYFSSLITLLYGFIADFPEIFFLDVGLLIILGVWLQLTYSKICGLIILAYGIFDVVIWIIKFGQLGGILLAIVGIIAVSATFKYDKAWGEYINTGNIPQYIK